MKLKNITLKYIKRSSEGYFTGSIFDISDGNIFIEDSNFEEVTILFDFTQVKALKIENVNVTTSYDNMIMRLYYC